MDVQTITITNAAINLVYLVVGVTIGITVPFAISALRQKISHRQLVLDDKRHTQKVVQGKVPPKPTNQSQPALNQQPAAI